MIQRSTVSALLASSALGALHGCASAPEAVEAPPPPPPRYLATWTPGAAARIVTINRESTFTVIEADRDLFVVRTDGHADGWNDATITWIISTPPAALGPNSYRLVQLTDELEASGASDRAGDAWSSPGSLASAGQAAGWAIVERPGHELTTRPVRGQIDIVGLDTDHAGILFSLETPGVAEVAVFEGDCVRVDRPRAIATAPIKTRSGTPLREQDDDDDGLTDSVWPWNDLFGRKSTVFDDI